MTAELDQTLEALADPTRRAVVDLLSTGPLRSGALAEALSLSPPAMSRHLRVLRRAGVVEEQAHDEDARVRVYRLRPESLQGLRSWVDEVSAFWGDQLAAFKAHAEATVEGQTAQSVKQAPVAEGQTAQSVKQAPVARAKRARRKG